MIQVIAIDWVWCVIKKSLWLPVWPTLTLQVMWCTWCPAGCSTTSSARLPRWLSRAQPTHTLQAPLLPYLRIGCLTMPPRKVSNSFSYFLFHILPLNRQTIKMYLSVSFCVKGKCPQNSIKSYLLKVSVLYLLNRKPCFLQLILFYVFLSDPLHGEQPRRREDRCASNSRQGGRACAHTGCGPFPSCCSPGIPFPAPSRQHNPCQKHCSTANCPAHPWSCYCPLHHSSSWKP